MRTSKINYFIVGIFVIAAIAGLIGSVALLTGRTGASDRYLAYYSNVTGVKFGTQVVYEGYPIGQVTEVVPEEKNGRMRFRIDFDINKGWKIPDDSSVEIAAPGLLAAVTLSISAGKSAAALTPGSVLKSRERSDIFAAVSGVAGDFSELTRDHLKPLLTNVDNTVTAIGEFLQIGGEGRMIAADARDTMSLARDIMRELQQRVPGITSKLDGILGDVGTTSRRLSDILTEDNRDKIVGMIDYMNAATQKFDAVLVNFNGILTDMNGIMFDADGDVGRTVKESRYIVESVARHVDSINQNMEGAARNLYEFSRQIRQNPGLLLGGKSPDDKGTPQ